MIPWIHCRQLCTLVYLSLTSRIVVKAFDLTDAQIDVVSLRLTVSAKARYGDGSFRHPPLKFCLTIYYFTQLGIGNKGTDNLGTKCDKLFCFLKAKSAST